MKHMIYVATAYKWGERDNHSYVVTASSKKHAVIVAAEEEEKIRGGKYTCEVLEIESGTSSWEKPFKVIRALNKVEL